MHGAGPRGSAQQHVGGERRVPLAAVATASAAATAEPAAAASASPTGNCPRSCGSPRWPQAVCVTGCCFRRMASHAKPNSRQRPWECARLEAAHGRGASHAAGTTTAGLPAAVHDAPPTVVRAGGSLCAAAFCTARLCTARVRTALRAARLCAALRAARLLPLRRHPSHSPLRLPPLLRPPSRRPLHCLLWRLMPMIRTASSPHPSLLPIPVECRQELPLWGAPAAYRVRNCLMERRCGWWLPPVPRTAH